MLASNCTLGPPTQPPPATPCAIFLNYVLICALDVSGAGSCANRWQIYVMPNQFLTSKFVLSSNASWHSLDDSHENFRVNGTMQLNGSILVDLDIWNSDQRISYSGSLPNSKSFGNGRTFIISYHYHDHDYYSLFIKFINEFNFYSLLLFF